MKWFLQYNIKTVNANRKQIKKYISTEGLFGEVRVVTAINKVP